MQTELEKIKNHMSAIDRLVSKLSKNGKPKRKTVKKMVEQKVDLYISKYTKN